MKCNYYKSRIRVAVMSLWLTHTHAHSLWLGVLLTEPAELKMIYRF